MDLQQQQNMLIMQQLLGMGPSSQIGMVPQTNPLSSPPAADQQASLGNQNMMGQGNPYAAMMSLPPMTPPPTSPY